MMREDKYKRMMLREAEIFGVDQFADSAVVIKGRIKPKLIRQWDVGREFLRRVKFAFDESSIEIPFPHRSIYFGEASKPIDLQLMERNGTVKQEGDEGAKGESPQKISRTINMANTGDDMEMD